MRWKRIAGLILMCMILVTGSACGRAGGEQSTTAENTTEENVKVELNQRQKDILEAGGLPADFEELQEDQKSAILVIEAGLEYMEDKYGGTFVYLGYVPSGVLEDEYLTCYKEGTPKEQVITVNVIYTSDHERTFEDNYAQVEAAIPYAQALNKYFSEDFNDNDFLVMSAEVNVNDINDDMTEADILNSAAASAVIVFSEKACTGDQLTEITENFCDWMQEENPDGRGTFRFYLFSEKAFAGLNEYNLDSVLQEYGFVNKVICDIMSDGSTRIH